MRRPHLSPGVVGAVTTVILLVLPGVPVRSAPVKEKVALRLSAAGEVKVEDFSSEDASVIDENTVVVVGTRRCDPESADPNKYDPDKLDPNGAIVDLARKASRTFTNGHKAGIFSVSVGRGRIVTASNHRDPVVRTWDLKSEKSGPEITIEKPARDGIRYGVCWFHTRDRLAITADARVILLDPAKPEERTDLFGPQDVGALSRPAVRVDDGRVACTAGKCDIVGWDVATKKELVSSLIPEKVEESEDWVSQGVAFGPKDAIIAWRSKGYTEVPERTREADVPADRRGVVRIDLPSGKVVPLGMGQTNYTLRCALDPTGTWLATVGSGRPDKTRPDGAVALGELRIYHLPSKDLAFREQVDGLPLNWVSFTPSGKRVVCATYDGVVRWWDVRGR